MVSTKKLLLIIFGSIFLIIAIAFAVLLQQTYASINGDPIAGALASSWIVICFVVIVVSGGISFLLLSMAIATKGEGINELAYGRCLERYGKEADCKNAVKKYKDKFDIYFEQKGVK